LETHQLKARIRNTTGKGAARTLRRQGMMPAVLYGSDIQNVPLAVSAYDIEYLFTRINYAQALLNLTVENGQPYEKTVMVKEVQADPLTQKYLHVDFYEVKMDRKITTTVPVVTTGVAKGVAEGGILQIIRRELDVTCLPGDIPQQLKIDISDLGIGDSIHIADIRPEGNIEIPFETNFTVVAVVSPKIVKEEAEAVEEEAAEEGEEKETEEASEE